MTKPRDLPKPRTKPIMHSFVSLARNTHGKDKRRKGCRPRSQYSYPYSSHSRGKAKSTSSGITLHLASLQTDTPGSELHGPITGLACRALPAVECSASHSRIDHAPFASSLAPAGMCPSCPPATVHHIACSREQEAHYH